jgi:hypothetical protein
LQGLAAYGRSSLETKGNSCPCPWADRAAGDRRRRSRSRHEVPTKINFLGTVGPNSDLRLLGDLDTNRKCRGAREMGLFRVTNNGFRLVDADRSSFNGGWAFRADLSGAPDIVIKAKKDTRNRGNVVCKAATLALSANSAQYPG